MTNEDDTFRVLRQRSFEETNHMVKILGQELNRKYPKPLTKVQHKEWMDTEDNALKEYGWTRDEYLDRYIANERYKDEIYKRGEDLRRLKEMGIRKD